MCGVRVVCGDRMIEFISNGVDMQKYEVLMKNNNNKKRLNTNRWIELTLNVGEDLYECYMYTL